MELGKTVLGIDFGTTRIKAVLLDEKHMPIASGVHQWENSFVDGIWTYPLSQVDDGLRSCFASLRQNVREKLGRELDTVGAIGVSAMMHGYLPFDKDGRQLAEFRTRRNTITGQAAAELTELFNFNIPQRWCIAHLYQAILNGEEHVKDIAQLTTLAGYVHWRLTGEKIVGTGEASGIFPLDSKTKNYDEERLSKFDTLIADRGYPWKLSELLPKAVPAGMSGGVLTAEGARYIDPEGILRPGAAVAPCEGDAGTGMVATNSVRAGTGNVSAGTSTFIMLVSDHDLGVHREVGMVTTPDGLPVAMVHCSNCTSDLNAWVQLLSEFANAIGAPQDMGQMYTMLFKKALEASPDAGGLLSYNHFSGEDILNLPEGRPLFARAPGSSLSLANFMRCHLLSALSTLRMGLDILYNEEQINVEKIYAHGGFFKTPVVGQSILSAAVNAPVSVMDSAGEGGAYGMALLCAYMLWHEEGESLADYLDNKVFADARSVTLMASKSEVEGFNAFHKRYTKAFELERLAAAKLDAI